MPKYKLFDGVCCLCLDKRKEHWQALQKEFETLGVEFIPYVCGDGTDSELKYDQIDEINPDITRWGYGVPNLKQHHYWAFRSHQGMITLAKKNDWESVLMLEDDAYITKRFDNIAKTIEETLLEKYNSFPIRYLGWWAFGDENSEENLNIEEEYNKNNRIELRKVEFNLGGLHGCVLDKSTYNTILNMEPINPIDTQLCFLRNKFPSIIICPKIIHIKSLYSMTEGVIFNRKLL